MRDRLTPTSFAPLTFAGYNALRTQRLSREPSKAAFAIRVI